MYLSAKLHLRKFFILPKRDEHRCNFILNPLLSCREIHNSYLVCCMPHSSRFLMKLYQIQSLLQHSILCYSDFFIQSEKNTPNHINRILNNRKECKNPKERTSVYMQCDAAECVRVSVCVARVPKSKEEFNGDSTKKKNGTKQCGVVMVVE